MTDIVERLRNNIKYDAETGVLTWRMDQANGKFKAGSEVGYVSHGYRRFGFGRKKIFCHVAAWMIFYGRLPAKFIDHINGDRLDNRIRNLRLASPSQNSFNQKLSKNNSTGLKGVQLRASGKFHAEICVNRERIALGTFVDKLDAARAYNEAALRLHGEFANVNNI